MPDFSPRTVLRTIQAFGFTTNAQVANLALEYGLDEVLGEGGIEKKEARLAQHIARHPELEGPDGGALVHELIERVVAARCTRRWGDPLDPDEELPELVHSLKQDGFVLVNGKLAPLLPEAVPVAELCDELTRLLQEYGFEVALGHMEQGTDAHARGDWAAANAQLRTFIEELFDRIASLLSGGQTDGFGSSHQRREWLARSRPEKGCWEFGGE